MMGLATFLSVVVLVLGWLQAVFSFVEPPTNVTLDCHNLNNVLKWRYKQLSPGLRFRVVIRSIQDAGYPKEIWVNTPAQLHVDVSFLSDPKNEYYLEVTAVIGQNESAAEGGLSFSYFKDSQADQKCNLDFPPVDVTTQHDDVLLSFTHPSLVYHKLPSGANKGARMRKSHELPLFRYDVMIRHQKERHHNFVCAERVCNANITVDATQKKHCLRMKGELEKIFVQSTQEYCALPPKEAPSYLIPICVTGGLLALSALGFVFYMVYRKWTTPNSATPKSVVFPNSLMQVITDEAKETWDVPEVEPTSPTPLLTAEETEFTAFVLPATEPELRLPIRVSTGEEGVSDDEDAATNEEPGYMHGPHLEEDEAPISSGYETRQVLVELAPDEVAAGYN